MGLDTNGIRFLFEAYREGVDFRNTATLARQELHLSPWQMRKVIKREAPGMPVQQMERLLDRWPRGNPYAEVFFESIGAKDIVSIDASDYEGATCVHNLNNELPDELKGKFSCVVDGGTLEHVFDLPNALLGCMQMLKRGGHFLAITPCNNFMGHGFYQLSPELIWSLFSERNGFELEKLYIFEEGAFAVWYEVASPRELLARVPLCNTKPTYLLYRARKTEDKVLTRSTIAPMQSDYELLWGGNHDASTPSLSRLLWRKLESRLPLHASDLFRDLKRRFSRKPRRGFSAPFYRKYR